jgi:hypothetical protein
VDDINVVGALSSSFLCLGELVDDIDVVGALSFLVQPQTVENNIAIATGVVSCPILNKQWIL